MKLSRRFSSSTRYLSTPAHLKAQLMAGGSDLSTPANVKLCRTCRVEKPSSDFYADTRTGWLAKECKPCACRRSAERARIRHTGRPEWGAQAVDRLVELQGGLCAICGIDIHRRPHLDHCHATGAVRGALCGKCNTGLGMFRDSPLFCEKAAIYLRYRGGPLPYIVETEIEAEAVYGASQKTG